MHNRFDPIATVIWEADPFRGKPEEAKAKNRGPGRNSPNLKGADLTPKKTDTFSFRQKHSENRGNGTSKGKAIGVPC